MAKSMPIRLAVLLAVWGILPVLPSRPAVAGGFWWQHGYGYGQPTMMMAQPSPTQVLTVVPATTTSRCLQLTPFTQLQVGTTAGLQLAPATTPLTTPGLTLSTGSPTSYYVVQPGLGSVSGLTLAPQVGAGSRGLTAGPGGVTDQDYQVLATGFGGSFINVQNFEQFLANQLDKLINQNTGLSQDQIITLLLDVAKGYLTSQGFGFLLDPTVDTIIKRLIGKVIQNRQASQGSGGGANGGTSGGTNGGTFNIPAGGFTFNVSGQIVLTPSGSGTVTPPPSNPQNPPNRTGLPQRLTQDQPNLPPPAKP
jgi:hypothetical protein